MPSRRTVLGMLAAVGLAGCSGDPDQFPETVRVENAVDETRTLRFAITRNTDEFLGHAEREYAPHETTTFGVNVETTAPCRVDVTGPGDLSAGTTWNVTERGETLAITVHRETVEFSDP